MQRENQTNLRSTATGVEVNKVLRNTYALLSATLLFSGVMAGVSMINQWAHPGLMITLIGYFGLLFLAGRFRNSGLGIVFVFALTGFMGLTLGPIISLYLTSLPNGGQIVMTAMGGTGVIFIGLSAYALTTGKDFSFLGGMLFTGILVAFLFGLCAIIFSIPALSMAVSAMFVLLMSALILYQTSQIINGGERNYIMATVTLYVAIYNLFLSLLQLLGIFSSD
ncbi:MAG: BAX inhibitor protein [Acidiferrobacteraceae bacterium]|nr:BAX inhibitor protein [Acidiferrobacteraceae bacterium]